ncbi:MAG: FAD-binding oxidoreductase [Pseudomonadota bacterium]
MPDLNEPTADDLSTLSAMVNGAVRSGDDAAPYLTEPRDVARGRAALVLRPGNTGEVAEIVNFCAARRIGVVPYGGGTGLVGGQVMADGPLPVVVSLERMNRIRDVIPEENALIAEAGVILSDIQAAAHDAGRLFPLSLASEGSCRIGGNLSTNAGGVQVLRYGNARDLCLGIEAVLPNGEILSGLKTLRKDNTGYDLRHLLLGAEGTLGILTAAVLKLFPIPQATVTAMLAVPGPSAATTLLHRLRDLLGDQITAFELIHGNGVEFVGRFHDVVDPLNGFPAWRVLAEVVGTDQEALQEQLETAFSSAFEDGLATDGVQALSDAQRQEMWKLRETIPEANRKVGAVSSHDISLPIKSLPEFIDEANDVISRIDSDLVTNCFGHLGDGNLHYNVFPPKGRRNQDYANRKMEVKTALHDLVNAYDGSVSAEHGIGRFKAADLVTYSDPAKVTAMRSIKAALDPAGIMNPGAVLV